MLFLANNVGTVDKMILWWKEICQRLVLSAIGKEVIFCRKLLTFHVFYLCISVCDFPNDR